MVSAALKTRDFADYRASFDVARRCDDVLRELESHLDAGAADTPPRSPASPWHIGNVRVS